MRTVIVRRDIAVTQLPLGLNRTDEPLPKGRLRAVSVYTPDAVSEVINFILGISDADDNFVSLSLIRNHETIEQDILRLRNTPSSVVCDVNIATENLFLASYNVSSSLSARRVIFTALMEVDD